MATLTHKYSPSLQLQLLEPCQHEAPSEPGSQSHSGLRPWKNSVEAHFIALPDSIWGDSGFEQEPWTQTVAASPLAFFWVSPRFGFCSLELTTECMGVYV